MFSMCRFIQGLMSAMLLLLSSNACAFSWHDLWLRADQQGAKLMTAGKPAQAAKHFLDPQWKGIAYYRAGDYEHAAKLFSQGSDLLSQYNYANALAHQGKYQDALARYDQVLEQDPHNQDAAFNKRLLETLLKQQTSKQGSSLSSKKKDRAQNSKSSPSQNQPMQHDNASGAQASSDHTSPSPTQMAWLRRIPDDPGGLLREKFLRDYLRRHQQGGTR